MPSKCRFPFFSVKSKGLSDALEKGPGSAFSNEIQLRKARILRNTKAGPLTLGLT